MPVDMPPRPSESHDFDYTTKQWVPNLDRAWFVVRRDRDRLLRDTDWRVTKATETGVSLDARWSDYRQALRDITAQPDPFNIGWPVAPSN
jgi:hypothetical protein